MYSYRQRDTHIHEDMKGLSLLLVSWYSGILAVTSGIKGNALLSAHTAVSFMNLFDGKRFIKAAWGNISAFGLCSRYHILCVVNCEQLTLLSYIPVTNHSGLKGNCRKVMWDFISSYYHVICHL